MPPIAMEQKRDSLKLYIAYAPAMVVLQTPHDKIEYEIVEKEIVGKWLDGSKIVSSSC